MAFPSRDLEAERREDLAIVDLHLGADCSGGQIYSINPDRIGAWGHSSGAHLAALQGTSGGVPELEGDGG
jgi:hypothetical protein